MPTVLLVDDDPSLLDVLSLPFEDAGYRVVVARDGVVGLAAIRERCPDVVISDVNMPGIDGFSLCRKLRHEKSYVPLLLLTSRDDEIDEALGLELGADDFIAKPFSTRVLLARVAALLRRRERRGEALTEKPRTTGALELFAERIEVRYRGAPIAVTMTEFRLLEALTRRPGIVLSRERLLERVRGDGSVVVDRIVDTDVRRLRRKLEATARPGARERGCRGLARAGRQALCARRPRAGRDHRSRRRVQHPCFESSSTGRARTSASWPTWSTSSRTLSPPCAPPPRP